MQERFLQPSKEKLGKGYDIHFEPGDHGQLQHQTATLTAVRKGNFSSHLWNAEVLKRIKEYGPKVLTLDSLGTHIDRTENLEDGAQAIHFSPIDPIGVWADLPGKPSEINPIGEVFVVFGDQLTSSRSFYGLEDQQALTSVIQKELSNNLAPRHEDAVFFQDVSKALAGVTGLAGITRYIQSREKEDDELTRHYYQSRREFMNMAGKGVTAAVLGRTISNVRNISTLFAGTAPTEAKKDHSVDFTDRISPRILVNGPQLDARNALYILKTKDALDLLRKDKDISSADSAAIIAGYSHSLGINRLMKNDANCAEAIRTYKKVLYGIVDDYKKRVNPSIDVQAARTNIEFNLASMHTYRITDPRTIGIGEKPEDQLKKSMEVVGAGWSQRVLDALK